MAKRAKNPAGGPDDLDPLLVAVGARIYEVRRELKLSQTQLAERADVAIQTVFQAESGSQNVSLKTLGRLAAALGLVVRDLLPESSVVTDPWFVEIAQALTLELGRATMLSQRLGTLIAEIEAEPRRTLLPAKPSDP